MLLFKCSLSTASSAIFASVIASAPNLSVVTDASEGVTVPPTAPDISTMKILAPLAGAVLNVIDAPPLAKV